MLIANLLFRIKKVVIEVYYRNAQTLLSTISKIGSLLAFLKFSIFLRMFHQRQFEKKLSDFKPEKKKNKDSVEQECEESLIKGLINDAESSLRSMSIIEEEE